MSAKVPPLLLLNGAVSARGTDAKSFAVARRSGRIPHLGSP